MTGDALTFPNLFQADKALWGGAWIFHACLFLILTRHLRYFVYPIPGVTADMQTLCVYAGLLFPIPALYLFWRRMALPCALSVAGVPDYAALLLLAAIGSTGLLMHYYARAYLAEVALPVWGMTCLQRVFDRFTTGKYPK